MQNSFPDWIFGRIVIVPFFSQVWAIVPVSVINCPISRIFLSGRDGLGGEAAQNAHPNPGKQTIQVTN